MDISVVIPLYNKKTSIRRALDSVLAQTFQPKEILVVNDGSTDGSEQLVEELRHPLIRLVNQENAGVSAARNRGILEAKHEWIAFLDGDDDWKEEYLEKITELNRAFPECSVLATNYLYQDYFGNLYPTCLNKLQFKGHLGRLENYFEVAAASSPPICSSAVVIQKMALQSIGMFPVGVNSGEDLLTWAKLASMYCIAYHTIPYSIFIQDKAHTYQDKPNIVPDLPDIVGKELLILRNRNKTASIDSYLGHWHKMRASVFLRLGMKKNCLQEVLKALIFQPTNPKLYIYLILNFFPLGVILKVFRRYQQNQV